MKHYTWLGQSWLTALSTLVLLFINYCVFSIQTTESLHSAHTVLKVLWNCRILVTSKENWLRLGWGRRGVLSEFRTTWPHFNTLEYSCLTKWPWVSIFRASQSRREYKPGTILYWKKLFEYKTISLSSLFNSIELYVYIFTMSRKRALNSFNFSPKIFWQRSLPFHICFRIRNRIKSDYQWPRKMRAGNKRGKEEGNECWGYQPCSSWHLWHDALALWLRLYGRRWSGELA